MPRSGGFAGSIDQLGLSEALLAEANRQLAARGFVVKRGALADAAIIAAAVSRLGRRRRQLSAIRTRGFTVNRGKTYFGDKAHLAADAESGLAPQAQMTSANGHDGRMGKALVQGGEEGYFTDKAYDSQAFRDTLERRGSWTASPGGSNLPVIRFQTWQKRLNAWAASLRSGVERADPTMKRWRGMSRVRDLGLARNTRHRQRVVVAMNRKRAVSGRSS